MPQGLFSRHEHRGLRDFSLHLLVLNGFLAVLGSLSAHRALLHCPQTGTCLQPVPHTGLWDNAFIVFQVEQHSALILFWCLIRPFTDPLFNQMGISGCLLGDVCAGTYPCLEFLCHSTHFFLLYSFLKSRSNPRSVPYIYRNQGMVLTFRCQVLKIKYL